MSGIALEDRPKAEELPVDEADLFLNADHASGGGKWTEARWLRIGDHFLTRSGKSATVVGLTIRIERTRVYNLLVQRLHNYAVGETAVLVHNGIPCDSDLGKALGRRANIKNTGKHYNDVFDNLVENHGVKLSDRKRLHDLLADIRKGLGQDPYIDMTGGVYHPITGEKLGELLQELI